MHTPVLLEAVIKALEVKEKGLYIDATAGEGGHLKKILEEGARVLAIDIDEEQIGYLEKGFKNYENLELVVGNFKDIEEIAKTFGFFPVDGIIFDLGLSMKQINESGRGFSYNKPRERLDMRLDQTKKIKASDIVNSLDADDLYGIFSKNSEELDSRTIAESIVRERRLRSIETVEDLLGVFKKLGGNKKTKARVFQALRMKVNNEKENLIKGLEGSLKLVRKGGKIAIVTFHSVEDRWVKRLIEEHKKEINKSSLIRPSKEKLSFERSAKLRVIIKK